MRSWNPTVNRVFGLDLIEIIWETRAYTEKEKEIQRSVWERFFSLPWKPFEKVKTILVKEPAMFSYQDQEAAR